MLDLIDLLSYNARIALRQQILSLFHEIMRTSVGFRQAVHTTIACLTFGAAEVAEAELLLAAAAALLFRGSRGLVCHSS